MATQIDRFLELLLRSGLAAPSDIVAWCADFSTSRTDDNSVGELCQHLVGKGVLTEWQCDKLRKRKWKGFYLDGYCLLSWIGKDATSATFLCKEIVTGNRVAMRVTPQDGRNHYEIIDPPSATVSGEQ